MDNRRSGDELFSLRYGNWLWQTVSDLGQRRQAFGQVRFERTRQVSPMIIAHLHARSVQAGFAAEAKHVLQGKHSEAGYGGLSGANEGPVDFFFTMSDVSLRCA